MSLLLKCISLFGKHEITFCADWFIWIRVSVKHNTSLIYSLWSYLMSKACLLSDQTLSNTTFNVLFDISQFPMSCKELFLRSRLYSCSAFSLALIYDLLKCPVKNSPLSNVILLDSVYIWPWSNAFCLFNSNPTAPTFSVNLCILCVVHAKLELKETVCAWYEETKQSSD